MIILFIFIILLNFSVILYNKKITKMLNLYDTPDGIRKLHKQKIPLIGGFIILINIIIIFIIDNTLLKLDLFYEFLNGIYLLIFVFIFFIFGFLDDKFDIKASYKLLISSILFLLFLIPNNNFLINELKFSFLENKLIFESIEAKYFVTIFCFLVFQNALNMFDGINLQCSLYSITFLIFLYYFDKNIIYLIFCLPLFFFSVLNFKNICFLGNNGVYLLSFVLSFFILNIQQKNDLFYADYIFILMALPGIDMLRLFILRLKDKKNPFQADKNHIHHVLTKKYSYNYAILLSFINYFLPILILLVIKNFLLAIILFSILYFFNLLKKPSS